MENLTRFVTSTICATNVVLMPCKGKARDENVSFKGKAISWEVDGSQSLSFVSREAQLFKMIYTENNHSLYHSNPGRI